ncbi:hypothetical protein M7I_1265 [Glarea lozoyensis 74030]|uniref:Uncharacterized protein n=1 Tax=Glarea lozoyensis (strain ATCC 74030 / MF5533) TaxID=1104152 RepID=H0EFI9_GLAL7|nr:hypothetical protein M7I_1265 [Glarea lozoyensis 74030]
MTITSAATTSSAVAVEISESAVSSEVISSTTSEAVFTIQTSVPPAAEVTSTGILVAPTPASTLASAPAVGNGTATSSSAAATSSLVVNNAGASISVQGMSGLMGVAAVLFAFLLNMFRGVCIFAWNWD